MEDVVSTIYCSKIRVCWLYLNVNDFNVMFRISNF